MTPGMVTNIVLSLAIFIAIGWAIGKEPKNPLSLSVAGAFVISVTLVFVMPRERVLATLLAVDALLVAVVAPYAARGNERAGIIAFLGTAKIAFTLISYWLGIIPNVRAAVRNATFVVQVLAAGGALDGGLAWLGNWARQFSRRHRKVLDRMEGE